MYIGLLHYTREPSQACTIIVARQNLYSILVVCVYVCVRVCACVCVCVCVYMCVYVCVGFCQLPPRGDPSTRLMSDSCLCERVE